MRTSIARAAARRALASSLAAASLVLLAVSRLLGVGRRRRRGGGGGARTRRTIPSLVADTSKSIAALRALESDRAPRDRLFRDPFAAALAGEDAMRRAIARGGDGGRIAIRTRYFDDVVVSALRGDGYGDGDAEDGTSTGAWQVVLLGAGLDARAWRLSPGKRVARARALFEVDVPEVLERKQSVIASGAFYNHTGPHTTPFAM